MQWKGRVRQDKGGRENCVCAYFFKVVLVVVVVVALVPWFVVTILLVK